MGYEFTLYEKRWKIELAFRDIKHALGSLHFHSKKDLFNLQEFFAHLVRYNFLDKDNFDKGAGRSCIHGNLPDFYLRPAQVHFLVQLVKHLPVV